jgi:hypothetical protein
MRSAGSDARGSWLLWGAKIAVSAGLLIWLACWVPLGQALTLLPRAHAGMVALAVLTLGLGLAVSAWRWSLVADGCLSLTGCMAHTWASAFWTLVLPGALSADVAKGLAVKSTTGSVCGRRLVTSILLDRIAGLATLLAAGLVFLALGGMVQGPWAAASGPAAACVLLGAWLAPGLLRSEVTRVVWAQVLMLSVVITLLNITFYWACAQSVGGLDSWPRMGGYTLMLNLAMLLPISIGGLGIREHLAVMTLANAGGEAGSVAFSWMVLLVTAAHGCFGLLLSSSYSSSEALEQGA